MLMADVHRQFGTAGTGRLIKLFMRDRGFRPLVTLRLYQAMRGKAPAPLAYPLLWLLHRLFCQRAGVDLPIKTDIGPALMIAHSWGIVINQGARIGRNVTIFHGVTLGQGDQIDADGVRSTGYPIIEDDVWIGPHAVIAGAVVVGAGSRIMANSVVTTDIPARSMVIGNPGVVARADCAPDVLHRVPDDAFAP